MTYGEQTIPADPDEATAADIQARKDSITNDLGAGFYFQTVDGVEVVGSAVIALHLDHFPNFQRGSCFFYINMPRINSRSRKFAAV